MSTHYRYTQGCIRLYLRVKVFCPINFSLASRLAFEIARGRGSWWQDKDGEGAGIGREKTEQVVWQREPNTGLEDMFSAFIKKREERKKRDYNKRSEGATELNSRRGTKIQNG